MTTGSNHFVRGIICTILGATLWGFSGTCAQFLLSQYGMPAHFIIFVRMLGSGIIFLSVMLVRKPQLLKEIVRDRKSVAQLLVFGICGLYLCQLTYIVAISYTNAGTATVLQCTSIIFIMIFTCLRMRRKPHFREFSGLILALVATFIIATHGNPTSMSISGEGLIWGLGAGVAAAFYALYPRKLLKKWGSFTVTGIGMLFGGILSIFVAQPWSMSLTLDGGAIAALVAITLLGTFGAFSLYLQGVADIGPMRASLLATIEPISATFFSWAWMGTQFLLIDCVGFAMMIVMVLMVTSDNQPEEPLDVTEVPPRSR